MVRLLNTQRHAQGLSRVRLRALLVAIVLIWIAGTNELMPILGLKTYPIVGWHFYPLGNVMDRALPVRTPVLLMSFFALKPSIDT